MSEGLSAIRATLERHGQQHVLAFHDQLDASGRQTLIDQLQGIDFARLDGLIDRFIRHEHHDRVPDSIEPAGFYPHEPGNAYDAGHYRRLGQDLIRAGKVAAFCVAGGQATRLGWSGPKGTFPGTRVKRNRDRSVERMITASCRAKLAPMQMRGPSPKGR